LPRTGTTFALSRNFAQRALWAAAIFARADADNFRVLVPFPYVLPNAASAAPIPRSSVANLSCSFFNNRTTPAKLVIEFPLVEGLYSDWPQGFANNQMTFELPTIREQRHAKDI
jgi:hypothetical protein